MMYVGVSGNFGSLWPPQGSFDTKVSDLCAEPGITPLDRVPARVADGRAAPGGDRLISR